MARVICKLPNCATVMIVGTQNGSCEVKFTEDRKQMLSEDIPDDVADHLDAIPGFTKVRAKAKETAEEKAAREAAEADAAKSGAGA